MDPILDSLNEEQRRAVLAKDGPVLINAGAGSGKTRVLTSRIALLLRDGVFPQEILALTFTKKAAGEMRTRIKTMAGPAADGLVMGTFHSVFVRFLREYSAYAGFNPNFTIYDADDSASCLHAVINETLFGPEWNNKELNKFLTEDQKKERKAILQKYKTKEVASRISRLKNDYIMPKDYRNDPALASHDARAGRPLLGEMYETYMKRCRRANAMDFDDILVYMYFILERYPEIARSIATRFRYILVDEYQDTNAIQCSIVSILSQAWGNICVVGDDSQSIYAFRGARIGNILGFKNEHPGMRTFKLETNYRSTPEIVEAANRLITFNENRLPKVCRASRPSGKYIDVLYHKNDRDEARYIASDILNRHRRGKPWSDHAVLYRTNAQARALEDAFIRARVPYVIYSGMSFFDRQEVKDVIAYMRLAVNRDDDEAFKRVCNRPARGISEQTLTALQVAASASDTTLAQVIDNLPFNTCGLKPAAMKALAAFQQLLCVLEQAAKENDALGAAEAIVKASGIYEHYDKEKDDDGRRRTNNIDELVNGIRYYIEEQREDAHDGPARIGLGDWLESISLLSAMDKDDGGDKASLMTSHCSKGLEFPVVYIAGVEEGLYPSLRDDSSDFDLEEERRLFYVSVTRAKDELVLNSCDNRWQYGNMKECEESRFINEMLPLDDEE